MHPFTLPLAAPASLGSYPCLTAVTTAAVAAVVAGTTAVLASTTAVLAGTTAANTGGLRLPILVGSSVLAGTTADVCIGCTVKWRAGVEAGIGC
jgi:hypothetical protein